eukprot:CAMPEP_0201477522 /NCGR_PEP_ID=MMETSP0151_2-20130828/2528_1 /ASSEMBLY_ACC=CAM_ASM_000257 /TAXON_ID=200890 /ORGANISM="Paramoeba atlantica, Strain 621/1 / CCAP 1560/9" /LENGTH=1132 /DNA_ID=CAMNT_0047858269 /DNA_START=73 /DNA_END=3471 /DNA_ORIENTATION=+
MFPFSGGTKGSNLDTFDFLSPKTDDFEEWKKKHDLGDPPPPSLTWTRHLENGFPPHQEFQVSTAEGLRLASLGYRMWKYIQKETKNGRIPIMNPFKKSAAGPRMGVPVGGFGSGTIGKGWRGDWGRNYLFQGFPNYNVVDVNAFSVSMSSKEDGSDGVGTVMTYGKPDNNKALKRTWNYDLKSSQSYYQGLYPRAWTTYDGEFPEMKIVCRQMSPVIPHNYKESSYPVGTFKWIMDNNSSSTKYVNIMFTFLNGTGDLNDSGGGHSNQVFERNIEGGTITGVALKHHVLPNERNLRILREVAKTEGNRGLALRMMKDSKKEEEDEEEQEVKRAIRVGDKPDPLEFAIAVLSESDDIEVSHVSTFSPNDKRSLKTIWNEFEKSKKLTPSPPSDARSEKGQEIAAALMVRVPVPADSKRTVTFALGWDFPIVRFNSGRGYYRRYTKFFGKDGNSVENIVSDALENDEDWEKQIEDWQNTILKDNRLPNWYKQALFNELYYLAEGGSVWTDGEEGVVEDVLSPAREEREEEKKEGEKKEGEKKGKGKKGGGKEERGLKEVSASSRKRKDAQRMTVSVAESPDLSVNPELCYSNDPLSLNFSKQMNEALCKGKKNPQVDLERYSEIQEEDSKETNEDAYEHLGKFGYLESMEYLMVNTYDVHFYASWALVQLWPLLDLTIQRDFAHSTLNDDYDIIWKTLHSGKKARRKVQYAVPHDLGNPGDDPWYKVNSYNIQEINCWKDLNCKFALQVYRDYLVTKNRQFLFSCWHAVEEALKYLIRFDKDGDGLIENEGFPDQTYDTWSALGASAYSGGLWLCALSAASAMCHEMDLERKAAQYHEMYLKAKKAYKAKLWNGKYFNYDTSANPQHDSIQTDMCCGQWWARALNLPQICDGDCFESSLSMIYNYNLKKFNDGKFGPINGMRPNGKIDETCMQSVEVWTGTAYGAASTMLQEGLVLEGFETAYGIVNVTYNTVGYMYQTPEAWDVNCNYRAIGYMRPLAIWGMQYAWDHFVSDELKEQLGDGTLTTLAERKLQQGLAAPIPVSGAMPLAIPFGPGNFGPVSSRRVRKDVTKWLITELKVSEEIADEYQTRLASPSVGVSCVDDLRWLLESDLDHIQMDQRHKKQLLAWVSSHRP